MAWRPFTPEELLELRRLAAQWGKIVARRAFGDKGSRPDVDFDTMEQIAHAAAQGLTEGTLQNPPRGSDRCLGRSATLSRLRAGLQRRASAAVTANQGRRTPAERAGRSLPRLPVGFLSPTADLATRRARVVGMVSKNEVAQGAEHVGDGAATGRQHRADQERREPLVGWTGK